MRKNISTIPDFENIWSVGPAKHKINLVSSYNTLTFFAPYIMKPTRFASQRLTADILINSIGYMPQSGNLTIRISHHLLQFVILVFLKRFYRRISILVKL